mgnify:CR=1 FL=1
MWFLILIIFSGPMEIERMDVLEIHWDEKKCIARAKQAVKTGIPENSNIGCVHVDGVGRANETSKIER